MVSQQDLKIMDKYPILISVPHGGTKIPSELTDRVSLSPLEQFADSDSFTRDIYGIEESVSAYVDTNIARAYVDLNRDVADRPPKNPDGIVKTQTCQGALVYKNGNELNDPLINTLLEKYYHPYHDKIRSTLETTKHITLALDCHSMEEVGPEISPDKGQPRPKICLGNNHGKSCSNDLTIKFAKCIQEAFQLNPYEVTINSPFAGGFITRTYGMQPIPWIQVEINRNLYLSPPWFNSKNQEMDSHRLSKLRDCFKQAVESFFILCENQTG
jgi:formiminoglutamase